MQPQEQVAGVRRLEALGEGVGDELVGGERARDAEVAERLGDLGRAGEREHVEVRRQRAQGDAGDEHVAVVGAGDEGVARRARAGSCG